MIRAIIETSLIDWDGKITTVLFFDKCNFRCPFCQNWELIIHPEKFPVIQWKEILEIIHKKTGWLDGIVLTGGEPLVNRDEILDLIHNIKKHKLPIKLDTNGAYPELLEELIKTKSIDYVAMDIKAPLDERYNTAAGVKVAIERIKQSIRLLMQGNVGYEFRTTCVPGIINEDTLKIIGVAVHGAQKWALQAYVPQNAYRTEYRTPLGTDYIPSLKKYHSIAEEYARSTILRGKV